MKKLKKILFCSFLGIVLFNQGMITEASEDVGGQVSTNGKISFYEDSSDSSTTESSTKEPVITTTKSLPSTGERESKEFAVIGSMVLLVFLLVGVSTRQKEDVT